MCHFLKEYGVVSVVFAKFGSYVGQKSRWVLFFGLWVSALERRIPFFDLWSIWKERNEKTFKKEESLLKELFSIVAVRVAKWVVVRRDFTNVKIKEIIHN